MLELLIYRLLCLGLVLFHIIMIFYELVVCVCANEGFDSVQAVTTGLQFLGFSEVSGFSQCPTSVCTHMHMCVHLGIVQDGKCSGNVKYYNYVQCSFLFLLCSQLGKGNSVSGQSHI